MGHNHNIWIPEAKLDSAAVSYVQTYSQNIRGPTKTSIPENHPNRIVAISSTNYRYGHVSYNVLYSDNSRGVVPGDFFPSVEEVDRLVMEGVAIRDGR